ncbi:hypothetical protein [Castellaniella sp.]|uniref:hypothetical protein n=1 Tax=Castellaniella sp. TaxID=1955812 RepID=UPI002AFEB425|nr:hypothetical protein [Castellaniella sp.]
MRYIASKTREFARRIGLKPLTTPVRSPQSNGMPAHMVGLAEGFRLLSVMLFHEISFGLGVRPSPIGIFFYILMAISLNFME